MTDNEKIIWVAAFLEGEGYFGLSRGPRNGTTPRIYVNQTDKDVVEKLRDFINPNLPIGIQTREGNKKDIYRFWCYGKIAEEWMIKILPYMGIRRHRTICEVLSMYNSCDPYIRAITTIAYSKNIRYEEAEEILVKEFK